MTLRMLAACESSGRVRSRTFPGVARAMADQWGSYIEGGQ